MTPVGRVSIIMPFVDERRFIREAIESVLAQTYSDWELLLVDDGSSDGSAEIALDYAARDPGRISYVAYPVSRTRGPAATRNLGIACAVGDYLAFLDGDDVWRADKLEQQTALLAAQREVGMVYGTSQWWYSWTGRPEDRERDHVEPLGLPAGVAIRPPSLLRPWFVRQEAAIPNPTSILVRRSLVARIGGFDESVPDGYEDQSFCAKAAVHAPIFVADQCWDRYRQHPGSLTAITRSRDGEAAARARFLTWLIGYLLEHAVDGEICDALRRQRIRYAHPWLDRIGRTLQSRAPRLRTPSYQRKSRSSKR